VATSPQCTSIKGAAQLLGVHHDGGPPPATSMYLPDPKAPKLLAGDSLDPGLWRRVKVDLYRLNGSASL
jgi:hypothetical protein